MKIIHEYASDRRAAPMALIVTRGDDLIETVNSYGVDTARKLTKWGMLEVDLRVKRDGLLRESGSTGRKAGCYAAAARPADPHTR